jgi:pyruvate/2-oxoglutarate/acetoin dehydrogenase E1 component
MNGYRPIVELMNTNFGIYGMAELSSAGNTYATTGGQFVMPMTIIGAGQCLALSSACKKVCTALLAVCHSVTWYSTHNTANT